MNLTTQINEVFDSSKSLVIADFAAAEKARLEKKRQENIALEEQQRLNARIQNDIRRHFANLKKNMKEIFAEPSALSQFLLDNVWDKPGHQFLTRREIRKVGKPKSSCPVLGISASSGIAVFDLKTKDINFQLIDLLKIESLSSERVCYMVAIGIPHLGFNVEAKNQALHYIEPIAYERRQAEGGALFTQECYIASSPPANIELRKALENLFDLSFFCKTILRSCMHLITS